MVDIRAKYGAKNTKKADFFHSSGYAKAQKGPDIGTVGDPTTFSTRQSIDQQRKYIQKYKNSRLIQGIHAYERVKSYTPRVEKASDVASGRGSLTPDNTPAQQTSSLSSTPSSPTAMQGYAARFNRNISSRFSRPPAKKPRH